MAENRVIDVDNDDSGRPKGLDLGYPAYSLGVPTIEVSNLLGQAEVVACAYGWGPSDEVYSDIPLVTLVGRNAGPLEEAFRIFKNWSAYPGDDALELSFVFLSDGGYLVCLSPEMRALQLRTLGYSRATKPIMLTMAWMKQFDTRHPLLGKLRSWHTAHQLTPFNFGAATLSDSSAASPENLSPLAPDLSILKFDATFADEGSLEPSDPLRSLVKMHRDRDNVGGNSFAESLPDPPKPTPREIREHRSKMLRTHLPVTSLRLLQSGRYETLRDLLGEPSIRIWQVVQAIGNLQISQLLTEGGLHYKPCSSDELPNLVAEVLDGRFESAGGRKEISAFSDEVLTEQIRLDAIASLTRLGVENVPDELSTLVEMLGRFELLE